jgi:hypothetical protein
MHSFLLKKNGFDRYICEVLPMRNVLQKTKLSFQKQFPAIFVVSFFRYMIKKIQDHFDDKILATSA